MTRTGAGGPATLVAIFTGGCAGGLARHLLSTALPASAGWPWGTLAANTAGAALLAVLLVALARRPAPEWVCPALATGFLGAFTTMSAVAVAVDTLAADGRAASAAGFLAASMLGGLGAAAVGLRVGRLMFGGGSAGGVQ